MASPGFSQLWGGGQGDRGVQPQGMWELLRFGAFRHLFLQILLCVTGDTEEVAGATAVVAERAEGRSCCAA